MGQVSLNRVTLALVVALLMLSLVPLTGWAGQVSLAQITFAGAGAFAMYQWAPFGSGSPAGLVLAAAFAIPLGFRDAERSRGAGAQYVLPKLRSTVRSRLDTISKPEA